MDDKGNNNEVVETSGKRLKYLLLNLRTAKSGMKMTRRKNVNIKSNSKNKSFNNA